jgi:hypothetical protein
MKTDCKDCQDYYTLLKRLSDAVSRVYRESPQDKGARVPDIIKLIKLNVEVQTLFNGAN